ncbi:MAG: hypothetical protein FGM14_02980 [Flavobacteriales bacterium]|nr:hypothetical protein [Flavobacteriales bacterium]
MKLKNIAIKNFRCFEEIELDFGSKTTVFIGKNGTGKSNILSAVRRGMSFIFAEDSKNKNDINSLKANNNSIVRRFEPYDTRIDEYSEGGYCWPTMIAYKTIFNGKQLDWEFFKKGFSSRLDQSMYKEAKTSILADLTREKVDYPILAFFADSYPHKEMNVGKNAKELIKLKKLPKDFGYYGWDEHVNCNTIWFARFLHAENVIKQFNEQLSNLQQSIYNLESTFPNLSSTEFDKKLKELELRKSSIFQKNEELNQILQKERAYIEEKLIKFTQPIRNNYDSINSEFEILNVYSSKYIFDKKPQIVFQFKDGKTMNMETLPMGYKRLLSIIFDIAYRSFVLNEGKNEPTGIVIIDEIELHLHPTLQQDVLERFNRTFPNIQFIVSTHSPLVISNFKVDNDQNKLIKLENNNNQYSKELVESVYGIDYSTNLSEVMEVAPRASTIDKYINAYLFLLGKKKEEEANKMFEKLKEYMGGSISSQLQKEIDSQKALIK